ncbi:hypothetical protein ACOTFF_06820 [Achromobacter xylosoxidans]
MIVVVLRVAGRIADQTFAAIAVFQRQVDQGVAAGANAEFAQEVVDAVAIGVRRAQRLAGVIGSQAPALDPGLPVRQGQHHAGLVVDGDVGHRRIEALLPARREAGFALRPLFLLARRDALPGHVRRIPAVVELQMVLAGKAAQSRIDHAAVETAVFHWHEAVAYLDGFQQAGVDEVRLRIAGHVAPHLGQVLVGRVDAVGGVDAVDLEQVLVGARAVEGDVLDIERTAVLGTASAGIGAHRGVVRHQRAQVAVRGRSCGDFLLAVEAFADLRAIDPHGIELRSAGCVGLVDVDDVAVRAFRARREARSLQHPVERQPGGEPAAHHRGHLARHGLGGKGDLQAGLTAQFDQRIAQRKGRNAETDGVGQRLGRRGSGQGQQGAEKKRRGAWGGMAWHEASLAPWMSAVGRRKPRDTSAPKRRVIGHIVRFDQKR